MSMSSAISDAFATYRESAVNVIRSIMDFMGGAIHFDEYPFTKYGQPDPFKITDNLVHIPAVISAGMSGLTLTAYVAGPDGNVGTEQFGGNFKALPTEVLNSLTTYLRDVYNHTQRDGIIYRNGNFYQKVPMTVVDLALNGNHPIANAREVDIDRDDAEWSRILVLEEDGEELWLDNVYGQAIICPVNIGMNGQGYYREIYE